MVREPKAFLLDEPLSNLDPALRSVARAELLQLHRSLHATIVYVTHDQEEALTLGTRVAVMRDGRIEQVAPPLDVYAAPANTFVAQFIGSPAMNLLPGSLLPLLSEGEPTALIDAAPAVHLIGVRPHDLALDRPGPLRATIDIVEPRGHDLLVHLTLLGQGEGTIVSVAPPGASVRPGLEVSVTAPLDRVHRFDRSNCRIGKI
jgi:ABC-type sugar transport system ATPase subunit